MITARATTDSSGYRCYGRYALIRNPKSYADAQGLENTNLDSPKAKSRSKCFNKLDKFDYAMAIIGCTGLSL